MERLQKEALEDARIDSIIKGFKQIGGIDPGKETEKYEKKKKGGSVKRKSGGTAKKHAGGGFDARLDESLGARHRGTKGNLAARRHESEGMERALGRRPYAAVGTMDRTAKKGGSVRRKKGSTVSRRGGRKIMHGYKAGGKV